MANFSVVKNTRTIVQNVEYSIAKDANYSSGSPMATTGYVSATVDLQAMVAGDTIEIRLYSAVNGGTQVPVILAALSGAQSQHYIVPLELVDTGWDITVKLTSATSRSINFVVVQDTNDVNVASITAGVFAAGAFAVGAITSTVIAAGAITTIATAAAAAVFAFIEEAGAPAGARSFLERQRIKWSVFAGKALGLTINTVSAEAFRDAADTKDRATFALAVDGTRTPGTLDGT